ncbi:hypothetical protein [Paraburkholderia oxyphila]|uniref:hypothetical protein n=1 Tax=Paraburkholderia oxyphila TaxID=614212 RepID=UPI0012EDF82A|nr:hypothetical protein [Paraburkholderia oxyphila]
MNASQARSKRAGSAHHGASLCGSYTVAIAPWVSHLQGRGDHAFTVQFTKRMALAGASASSFAMRNHWRPDGGCLPVGMEHRECCGNGGIGLRCVRIGELRAGDVEAGGMQIGGIVGQGGL